VDTHGPEDGSEVRRLASVTVLVEVDQPASLTCLLTDMMSNEVRHTRLAGLGGS
jgi:hypothetical protein